MKKNIIDNVLLAIVCIAFFTNIVILNITSTQNSILRIIGYVILFIGLLLTVSAIITILINGNKKIIDKGVYGLIRHPMYAGGIILFLSHIFFSQHPVIIISTIAGIICCFIIINIEDKKIAEKFGDQYADYCRAVPKINIFKGIYKILIKSTS